MVQFNKKTIETAYGTIGSGIKKVTAASTPESLATSTPTKNVLIKSLAGNTDIVVIGGSNVSATPTSSPIGVPLAATGETIEVKVDNLSKIYVAVAVDGEGVSYLYFQ